MTARSASRKKAAAKKTAKPSVKQPARPKVKATATSRPPAPGKRPPPAAKKSVPKAAKKPAPAAKKRPEKAARKNSGAVKLVKKIAAKRAETQKEGPDLLGASRAWRDLAVKTLKDMKGEGVKTIDLSRRSALADYLIVASGKSTRQVKAMADQLLRKLGAAGMKDVRLEGLPQADWVVVDAGDIVVHLLRPEVRDYYRLEDIWSSL